MNDVKSACSRLMHEEDGQSLIEYSLIAGVVAVGAIVGMTYLKTTIVNFFYYVGTQMNSAV